ncbi:tetratricopeptide repeat protein [Ktedonospora formicarum]|uniref:MalT-like TPR region domain-containing protein n=1 Tax=Ktedonospora formicarum TaxID=2778364 RepID=A0A8J3I585_9CHLR|nr:tetratricopeptide repeat protein [Ktedonospora formicarum]GHO47288.1 hypothetical protein KSX_54510 [Ktedonospora formicarum]
MSFNIPPLKSMMDSWRARQEQQQKEIALVEQDLRQRAQTLLLTLLRSRADSLKLFEEVTALQQRVETLRQQEDVQGAIQVYLRIIDLYEHEHQQRDESDYSKLDLPLIGATLHAAHFHAQHLLLADATVLGHKALDLCEHIYEYEWLDFDTLMDYDYAEQAAQQGKLVKAEMYFEKLLRVFAERYGAEDSRIALALSIWACFAVQKKRDFPLAEHLLLEALELRERYFEQGHPLLVSTWLMLTIVYLWQQRYDDARQALSQVKYLRPLHILIIDTDALRQDVFDLESLSSQWRILNAGLKVSDRMQQRMQGIQQDFGEQMQGRAGKQLQEAEAFVQQLPDEQEETQQDDEYAQEQSGLQHLSMISQLQFNEKYSEAEALAQRILQNTEKAYGPRHMMVATVMSSLASLYQQQAKYEETVQCYERVVSIYEDLYGPEHTYTTSSQSLLASALIDKGNDEEAEKICQRLLTVAAKNTQLSQTSDPLPLRCMARLCLKQKRYEEAENYARRLLHHFEQRWGSQHTALCEALGLLMRAMLYLRRYVEANLYYQRALAISGTQTVHASPATRHALEQWETELKRDYRALSQSAQGQAFEQE